MKAILEKTMRALALAFALLAIPSAPLHAEGAKDVLVAYEPLSKALAADDLGTAKNAATNLADIAKKANEADLAKQAEIIASAATIDDARSAFRVASTRAVELAKNTDGFYVLTCPMAKGDWVQSTKQAANPYMGKKMYDCGMVKK